jgi:hypothetical protein
VLAASPRNFCKVFADATVAASLVVVSDGWDPWPKNAGARIVQLSPSIPRRIALHALHQSGAQTGATHDGGRNTDAAGCVQAVVSTLEIGLFRLLGGQE